MNPIHLIIVDNHPATVEGLRLGLPSRGDFEIVATGRTSAEALALAASLRRGVMMIDPAVPGDTLAAIRYASARFPDLRILVFTSAAGMDNAIGALEAGARGYVSKASEMEELADAIKSVAAGSTYVSRDFGVGAITALKNASVRKIAMQALSLSAREDQIVALLIKGKTNKEIAVHLGIAERTVKHYMGELMQKLNARNRVEAVVAAQNLTRSAGGIALPAHLAARPAPSPVELDIGHPGSISATRRRLS